MWLLNRKNKKNEVRRGQPTRVPNTLDRLRQSVSPWAVVVGVAFVLLTSAVIIVGGQVMPWALGQKPRQDIRVRAAFQELDEQKTVQARDQARQSTPNYYELNRAFLEQIDQDLTLFFTDLKAVGQYKDLPAAKKQVFEKTWHVNDASFTEFRKLVADMPPGEFQNRVQQLRRTLIAENVIEVLPEEYRMSKTVILADPQTKAPRPVSQWIFDSDTGKVDALIHRSALSFKPGLQSVVERYLKEHFRPAWLFDKAATDKQRQARFDAEDNRRYNKFEPGSLLIRQDQEIDKRELQLLEMEHEAYWNSINSRDRLLANTGIAVVVGLVFVGLWVYCYKFQRRAIHNWSRAGMLALALFAMVAMARILDLGGWNVYTSVFEVVLIAMVLTIAYDARFALVVNVALMALLMLALNGNISLMLTLLGAGATVALTLEDIRSRSKLIEVASAAALMAFAVVWASQLANYQEVKFFTLKSALSAAGGALAAGLLVQGLLPVIERLFQIATSMTLLEYCDASKPLLRRLGLEAPGTFSHSLLIGSLAEASADAVGANGLLARVGSYYHDIGKVNKSKYFVENQPGNVITRHKGLSPGMSLLIIISHVKDGLELAKEYGLPKVISQFIAEHHGTTLVEYFFHLASQQPESNKEALDVAFRYPGPKPRSKETAIVMLADGVEGATRSLAEPTVGRIESIVHQIAKKRLEDGQFDECDITLRELHVVEETLTKSLCALYHSRVAYPSSSPPATAPAGPEITATKVASGTELANGTSLNLPEKLGTPVASDPAENPPPEPNGSEG